MFLHNIKSQQRFLEWLSCPQVLERSYTRMSNPATAPNSPSWQFCFSRWVLWLSLGSLILATGSALLNPADDHVEATVISTAWLWMHGWPIHQNLTDPSCYSILYGPLLHLFVAGGLLALGPSLFAAAVTSVLACWGSVWFLFLACRRLVPQTTALFVTGLYGAFLLTSLMPTAGYWVRPDSFLLFFSALACWLAVIRRPWSQAALSVTAGLMAALKPHGFLPVAPLLVALMPLKSWRAWMTVIGGFLAAVIFCYAATGDSILNQYALSTLVVSQPFDWYLVSINLCYLFILLLPLAALLFQTRAGAAAFSTWRHWLLFLAAALALLLGLVPASKVTSGTNHLVAFLPLIVFADAWALTFALTHDAIRRFVTATKFLVILAATFSIYLSHLAGLHRQWIAEARAELRQYEIHHPTQHVAIGIGRSWNGYQTIAALQAEQTLQHHFLVIDMDAWMYRSGMGMELPTAISDAMFNRYEAWAIPAGEEPFTWLSPYQISNPQPLFSAEFGTTFKQRYHRVFRGRLLDIWERQR